MNPRPIRVAHLITGLGMGGAERTLLNLVKRMDRTRFVNTVISLLDSGVMGDAFASAGVPIIELKMRPGRPSFGATLHLLQFLREFRPAVLQSWLYHADLMAIVLGRMARVPTVIWNIRCSDVDMRHYPLLSTITLKTLALLSRFPDTVVVNSQRGLETHRALGYRCRDWQLIPNGIDTRLFSPMPATVREGHRRRFGVTGEPVIGLLARFDAMKDHGTFFDAAGLVAERLPRACFLLGGRGVTHDNPRVAEMVARNRLRGAVLLGEVKDAPAFYSACDVFVLSSSSEGFPNVVAEAMACEVPCVVTDAGYAPEIVRDTGRVVPTRNPAPLARAIIEVLELAPDVRIDLGARARSRIVESFSIDRMIGAYETLYSRRIAL